MSTLAPTLQAFFTDRLMRQRDASPATIAAYRDTFRLLLAFAQHRTGKAPSMLGLDDLDVALIVAFLDHLQADRGNSARTRNIRLAAVRSLFRYAALRHPKHAGLIPTGTGHPPEALRQTGHLVPHRSRGRRAPRRCRPRHLGRKT